MSSFLGFADYAPIPLTYGPSKGHVGKVRQYRQPGQAFTVQQMRSQTGLSDTQTRSAITVLMKSGVVTVEKVGHRATYRWTSEADQRQGGR